MRLRRFLVICLVLLCGACGGGSSSNAGNDIIDRSGRTVGSISGFGSVIVNGVAYDTSTAVITVDETSASEADLQVGQIVLLEGRVDANGSTGTADSVSVDANVKGPIAEIDAVNETLSVLGTPVAITAETIFDVSIAQQSLAGLAVGDTVEVYGFANSQGVVAATLIKPSTDTELQVRGTVAALDANAQTFSINALTIDYASASLDGFVAAIAVGDFVEVEGAVLQNGVLIALRVELQEEANLNALEAGTEIELEGFITQFTDASDFAVGGTAVSTDAATEFEGGTLADLALDVRVEVEGRITNTGVLLASEIEFEVEVNLEAEARVEEVDAAASRVRVLGIDFMATPQTQLIDESDTQLQIFSLNDVVVDDFVKLKANVADDAVTLALLKRKNPEDQLKLQGSVSSISPPNVFVNNARIDTQGTSSFSLDDTEVSATEFFNQLVVGDEISAEGQSNSAGVLQAQSIEIED